MEYNFQNKVVRLHSQNIQLNWLEPYKLENNSSGICSGAFIDKDGLILTCSHCIDKSSNVFFEIPYNGPERYEAEIIFLCPEHDIALLKSKNLKIKNILI